MKFGGSFELIGRERRRGSAEGGPPAGMRHHIGRTIRVSWRHVVQSGKELRMRHPRAYGGRGYAQSTRFPSPAPTRLPLRDRVISRVGICVHSLRIGQKFPLILLKLLKLCLIANGHKDWVFS